MNFERYKHFNTREYDNNKRSICDIFKINIYMQQYRGYGFPVGCIIFPPVALSMNNP